MKKLFFTIFVSVVLAGPAHADALAKWNSTGATPQALDFAPTDVAANVTVSNLVRGSGLVVRTTPGNSYVASGYAADTNTTAMAAGDYWETSLTPDTDYSLIFTTLSNSFRATAAGPDFAQWAYSLDGNTFTWLGAPFEVTTAYTTRTVDLSMVPALQGVTGRIWFRLAAWGGTDAGTATGAFGQSKDVLTFEGTVVSLAQPPTIAFSPAVPSVPVSNTLVVTVQAFPEGSAVQSCSLLPAPAGSGTWNAGSSTYTFIPAAADENVAFTLRAVATNRFGTATNTAAVKVTYYVVPGSYVIDFESQTQGSYGQDIIRNFNGVNWNMTQCLISNDVNAVGTKALRFRYANGPVVAFTSVDPIPTDGVGMISFMYSSFNSSYDGPVLAVEISNTPDGPWVEVGEASAPMTAGQQWFTNYPAMREPAYIRFRAKSGDNGNLGNLDDIVISPYAAFAPGTGSYEAFLLQYNVTPGDNLTALNEDYDGDGATNQAEWSAGTNPYDKTSKP